jgi:Holliday junction DNA helicase RuvA
MISYLIGQPRLERDGITMLIGGVGYGVRVSEDLRQELALQTEASLYIYTHVREDALELFGFRSDAERSMFLLLTYVSGLGPKTALHIMNLGTTRITTAVQNADTSLFASVPRVGKKLAQKIIIELRSKLGALKELDLAPLSPSQQEMLEALLSLGFHESDAQRVISSADVAELEVAAGVKKAIQLLGTQG